MKTTFRLYLPKKSPAPPPEEPPFSLAYLRDVPAGRSPWRSLAARVARRRCPVCGAGGVFADRLTLVARCPGCGYRFEREPGYWLGAMVINYGFVVALGVAMFALANGLWSWPALVQVVVWSVFAVVGIVWFFPYSRLLWVLFDFAFLRPPGATDFLPEAPPEPSDPTVRR